MLLCVNALAHFLVDGVCVSALFAAGAEGKTLALAVVLYNTLAFSTQCVVGLWLDRSVRLRFWTVASMVLVACSFFLPVPFLLRISFIGIGNSVFHVAAGAVTLRSSGGKALPLGVFVAPGAFGVSLGTCFPLYGRYFSIALVGCAAARLLLSEDGAASAKPQRRETQTGFPLSILLLLTAAVAVRAIGGASVRFPWKEGAGDAFLLTGFVFAGKALGGVVCDRFGAKATALLSIPLAAVLIAFFSAYPAPALLGQFLLNLSMPVTLFLLYLALPEEPAFAFGLAASALWPGTIAGMLFQFTGPASSVCVILSFLFGLFAIMIAIHRLKLRERGIR